MFKKSKIYSGKLGIFRISWGFQGFLKVSGFPEIFEVSWNFRDFLKFSRFPEIFKISWNFQNLLKIIKIFWKSFQNFPKNFKGVPDYLKPFRIIPLYYGSIEYQWYLEDGAFAGNILKDQFKVFLWNTSSSASGVIFWSRLHWQYSY